MGGVLCGRDHRQASVPSLAVMFVDQQLSCVFWVYYLNVLRPGLIGLIFE